MSKSAKPVKRITALADLTPDSMNPNRGTERGRHLVDWSLTELGAGRSILIDRSGNVIAGNKTLEAATAHNLPLRVIETDGSELVAVQRTDLDMFGDDDDERRTARQLSIVDNEANRAGYERDAEMLLTHQASGVDLEPIIPAAEVEHLKAVLMAQSAEGSPIGISNGKANYDELWQGMPEFGNHPKAFASLIVHFKNESDMEEFAIAVSQPIKATTKYIWFPFQNKKSHSGEYFEGEE